VLVRMRPRLTRKSAFNIYGQIANDCRRRDSVSLLSLMFAFEYDKPLLFERIELNLLEQFGLGVQFCVARRKFVGTQ
jgi:hypothetical protein